MLGAQVIKIMCQGMALGALRIRIDGNRMEFAAEVMFPVWFPCPSVSPSIGSSVCQYFPDSPQIYRGYERPSDEYRERRTTDGHTGSLTDRQTGRHRDERAWKKRKNPLRKLA